MAFYQTNEKREGSDELKIISQKKQGFEHRAV
jgi:hypothetical protein